VRECKEATDSRIGIKNKAQERSRKSHGRVFFLKGAEKKVKGKRLARVDRTSAETGRSRATLAPVCPRHKIFNIEWEAAFDKEGVFTSHRDDACCRTG